MSHINLLPWPFLLCWHLSRIHLGNCTQATRGYIDFSALVESAANRKRNGTYTESASALKTTHREVTTTFESQLPKAVTREKGPLENSRGTIDSLLTCNAAVRVTTTVPPFPVRLHGVHRENFALSVSPIQTSLTSVTSVYDLQKEIFQPLLLLESY
jgi:hypothetical protein